MIYTGKVKWFQKTPKGCGFIRMPITQINKESPSFLKAILIKDKTKTKIVDDFAEIFLHITNVEPNHKIPDISYSTSMSTSSVDVNVEFELKSGKFGPLAHKVRIV
jgi:cold shock CspA family protein